ncbi:hypothetical protein AAFF_G00143540 [Aldrovandia affinis]|uniref:Uncharacterized protein n=1 Tax=Aldrovandia affinis TaxID=143900 RepID=A0AAD7T1G5_9TELE|nr:hypothetical protein AAFF_G00143540 [Aldrovandia affinis]
MVGLVFEVVRSDRHVRHDKCVCVEAEKSASSLLSNSHLVTAPHPNPDAALTPVGGRQVAADHNIAVGGRCADVLNVCRSNIGPVPVQRESAACRVRPLSLSGHLEWLDMEKRKKSKAKMMLESKLG